MDVEAILLADTLPHRTSLATSSPESLAKGVPGLLRLLDNLSKDVVDPKHRRLRLSNATLRGHILDPLPGALDMLQAMGYALQEDSGEMYLVLEDMRHSPAQAKAEIAWLRQLVENTWRPQPWCCPACTLRNEAAASKCAVCEGPRPESAAPPAVPMPQLTAASPPESKHPGTSVALRHAGASAVEQSRRSESMSRVRTERQRERDRILAEARADRQRFGEVSAPSGRASPSRTSDAAPAVSTSPEMHAAAPAAPVVHTALRVRLPDGAVAEETFASSETLSQVFFIIDALLEARGEPVDDYALLQAIPRRVFIREVLGSRSLTELGLAPSATLSVLRAEDRGRVASGDVETALMTGDIDGLSYEEMMEFESRIGDAQSKRRPSKRMREAQTRVHIYSASRSAAEATGEEKRCAICLENFSEGAKLRTLWCRHCFHVTCIDRWLEDQDECPVCRKSASQI